MSVSLNKEIHDLDLKLTRLLDSRRKFYIGLLVLLIACLVAYLVYRIWFRHRNTDSVIPVPSIPYIVIQINNNIDQMPKYFSYKTEYLVEPINQNKCGSCYIIATCNMLSDRICIGTNGMVKEFLSPQYLLCIDSGDTHDDACSGGSPETVLEYIESRGVILDKYMPYNQVGEHLNKQACVISPQHTKALNPENRVYIEPGSAKHLCVERFTIGSQTHLDNINRMKTDIVQNGPIVGTIYVHEDLYDYRGNGAIYSKSKGSRFLYGHAIEIVGFCDTGGCHTSVLGHALSPEPYWIVKNSWSRNYGMGGYIYIRMYTNECEIESRASSAIPKMSETLYHTISNNVMNLRGTGDTKAYEVIV